jgi:hypothetical protein
MENMRMEMVRELREMKQNLKDANISNTEMIKELKEMNMQLIK